MRSSRPSTKRIKRFCWKTDGSSFQPINYDYLNRPRRQEFDGYLVENGAFYINSRKGLLADGCRLSGKVGTYEMPEETYFEIDEPSDWIVIEHLLRRSRSSGAAFAERASKVKILLTDCDGVLTDGGL